MAEKIKTDIFSGFLGAGKTTLIKKLIKESYRGEKVVLIENEFGEIGIDGGFLADAGITVNEMNSGCICCSLVGDFGKALRQVIETYSPERILIEPSGVGKLSDIIRAVENLHEERLVLNGFATVADAKKCRMYMRNFGEFFNDQIENAGAVILSHTAGLSKEKIDETAALIREHNPDAVIVSTDWDELTGDDILAAMEKRTTIEAELKKLAEEVTCPVCGHHHGHDHEHHHDECCGGHDHEHHHDECDGHDHEHHHDECDGHGHEHHHDECGGHDHEHHHGHHHGHHHADEVFTSCGFETAHTFTAEGLSAMLEALGDEALYGTVLRAKGIVASADGGAWLHFDYVPGETDIRRGPAAVTGRLCIIGAGIDEERLKALFAL